MTQCTIVRYRVHADSAAGFSKPVRMDTYNLLDHHN